MVRILIVDDEPDAVELLREFLAGKNYEVSEAANGEGGKPVGAAASGEAPPNAAPGVKAPKSCATSSDAVLLSSPTPSRVAQRT